MSRIRTQGWPWSKKAAPSPSSPPAPVDTRRDVDDSVAQYDILLRGLDEQEAHLLNEVSSLRVQYEELQIPAREAKRILDATEAKLAAINQQRQEVKAKRDYLYRGGESLTGPYSPQYSGVVSLPGGRMGKKFRSRR